MTTIVFHNKQLFVDSRAYSGTKTPVGLKNKLHVIPTGVFAGSSTEIGAAERLLILLEENSVKAPVNEELNVDAIFAHNNGEVYFYGGGPGWTLIDADQHLSVGSGAQYALGAMAAGSSGMEAMLIACQLDVWSGPPITSRMIGTPYT